MTTLTNGTETTTLDEFNLSEHIGRNCIDGEWIGARSGETFSDFNPTHPNQVIAEVADSGTDDAVLAIEAARRAGPGWESLASGFHD